MFHILISTGWFVMVWCFSAFFLTNDEPKDIFAFGLTVGLILALIGAFGVDYKNNS